MDKNSQLMAIFNKRRQADQTLESEKQIQVVQKEQKSKQSEIQGINHSQFQANKKKIKQMLEKQQGISHISEAKNQPKIQKQQIKGNHEEFENARKMLNEKFSKNNTNTSSPSIGLPPPPSLDQLPSLPLPSLNLPPPPPLNLPNPPTFDLPPPPSLILPTPPTINLPPPPPSLNQKSQPSPNKSENNAAKNQITSKDQCSPLIKTSLQPKNSQKQEIRSPQMPKNQKSKPKSKPKSKQKPKPKQKQKQAQVQKISKKQSETISPNSPTKKKPTAIVLPANQPLQSDQTCFVVSKGSKIGKRPQQPQKPLQGQKTKKKQKQRLTMPNSRKKLSSQILHKDVALFLKRQFLKTSDTINNIGLPVNKKMYNFNFPSIEQNLRNIELNQTIFTDTNELDVVPCYMQKNINALKQHQAAKNKFLDQYNGYDWQKDSLKLKQIQDITNDFSFDSLKDYMEPNLVQVKNALNRCDNLIKIFSKNQNYTACAQLKDAKKNLRQMIELYCKEPEKNVALYDKIEENIRIIKNTKL